MPRTSHKVAIVILAVAGLLPAAGARAQWYSSVPQQPAPLYPYAMPSNQPYAVEVAPNTYVIQRPGVPAARVRPADRPAPVKAELSSRHRRSKVDPALIEELRQRPKLKTRTIDTTRIVREPPIVKETKRYVDDPPRVVERYHVAEEAPAHSHNKRAAVDDGGNGAIIIKRKDAARNLRNGEKRVIDADAEITILGPDRMSIRLFRKGSGNKAKAQAEQAD
jgi:hypothetical protein